MVGFLPATRETCGLNSQRPASDCQTLWAFVNQQIRMHFLCVSASHINLNKSKKLFKKQYTLVTSNSLSQLQLLSFGQPQVARCSANIPNVELCSTGLFLRFIFSVLLSHCVLANTSRLCGGSPYPVLILRTASLFQNHRFWICQTRIVKF